MKDPIGVWSFVNTCIYQDALACAGLSEAGSWREESTLDENGFREFCIKRKLNEQSIQAHLAILREFETFVSENEGKRDLANATARSA